MSNDKPVECEACCCVDMGSIIDNNECLFEFTKDFASKVEAEEVLAALTSKAKEVESEPCKIVSDIQSNGEGVTLSASFDFACQAETLIFQLGMR